MSKMPNLKIDSDIYGKYEAEFLVQLDYKKSKNVWEIIDLYKDIFGRVLYSKWEGEWPDYYPEGIKKITPHRYENLYYPTEKSAPGNPVADDRAVKKFRKKLKEIKG